MYEIINVEILKCLHVNEKSAKLWFYQVLCKASPTEELIPKMELIPKVKELESRFL